MRIMSSWYLDNAAQSDICVSTRVRLARNVVGYPFPSRMTDSDFQKLCESVKNAILGSNTPFAKSLKFINMDSVPKLQVLAMVERHIISPEFAEHSQNKAVIISEDESVCIMIGEEDHIRIQVLSPGFNLDEAYETANRIDDILSEKLKFAFNSQLGYLTECPTNLGTGLRASVMLHLPLLSFVHEIGSIANSLGKIGFTVRGLYGEGSESAAGLYQLSNQITLGISEKDALKNLKTLANQIIEREKNALQSVDRLKLEDSVFRAYGILKNARILSSKEMMNCISLIKLGANMEILNIDKHLPIKLLVENQPGMIMCASGELDALERDVIRAEKIRNSI